MPAASLLGGAFRAVANGRAALADWWSEKTFWPYYYTFTYDPHDLLNILPGSTQTHEFLAEKINQMRGTFLASAAAQMAGTNPAKPTGEALTQLQAGLRPALELGLRSAGRSPLLLTCAGIAALLVFDYLAGGPIRDTLTHLIATGNSESGKVNDAPPAATKPQTSLPSYYFA